MPKSAQEKLFDFLKERNLTRFNSYDEYVLGTSRSAEKPQEEMGVCDIHGRWENYTEFKGCPVCEYDKNQIVKPQKGTVAKITTVENPHIEKIGIDLLKEEKIAEEKRVEKKKAYKEFKKELSPRDLADYNEMFSENEDT